MWRGSSVSLGWAVAGAGKPSTEESPEGYTAGALQLGQWGLRVISDAIGTVNSLAVSNSWLPGLLAPGAAPEGGPPTLFSVDKTSGSPVSQLTSSKIGLWVPGTSPPAPRFITAAPGGAPLWNGDPWPGGGGGGTWVGTATSALDMSTYPITDSLSAQGAVRAPNGVALTPAVSGAVSGIISSTPSGSALPLWNGGAWPARWVGTANSDLQMGGGTYAIETYGAGFPVYITRSSAGGLDVNGPIKGSSLITLGARGAPQGSLSTHATTGAPQWNGGAWPPGPSSWVGTATSALDMAGNAIGDAKELSLSRLGYYGLIGVSTTSPSLPLWNGAAWPGGGGGGWVGTATSDLDMAAYRISGDGNTVRTGKLQITDETHASATGVLGVTDAGNTPLWNDAAWPSSWVGVATSNLDVQNHVITNSLTTTAQ